MKTSTNKISHIDLQKNLSEGEISPVYVFTGNQTYLMDEAVSDLKRIVLGNSTDFNLSLFYGDSASAKEIIDTAKTYPMLSRMRLAIVKNVEKLPDGEFKLMESYPLSPSPFTCLVLIFGAQDNARLNALDKKGVIFVRFDIKDVFEAIHREVKKLGCSITKEAVQSLISLVGDNMQDIHSELQRLVLFTGRGKTIEVEDVEKLIQKAQSEDVFGLINAIAARDKEKAIKALLDLETTDEEPLAILSRIGWRFRLIWRAKELIDKNVSRDAISKELKVSPGALYYIGQQAKSLSYEEIKRIIGILYEGDRMLKTAYIPKSVALTNLILELCG
ncbi:MAG: DNA polymerase III subunit delta [Candidatus Dadabacteria bacterium]